MIWNEILCLGDSLTYGARDEHKSSYTVELSRILREKTKETYICHNEGISGETSSDLLRRAWRNVKSNKESKLCVLLIGTNDTQINNPPHIFEENIKQIINIVKIHKMNLILCTLPKLGFTTLYLKNSKNIELYNEIIKKLSKEYNLYLCDLSGIEKYYVDGVHLNHEGNIDLANRVAKVFLESQN